MQGMGFLFILLFLASQEYSVHAALCARRSLSEDSARAGMLIEVAISLSLGDTSPSAFILVETLPEGLQFQHATWNGNSFAPSIRDGQTVKWFFGPGGKAVSEGILAYQASVLTGSSEKVFFAGYAQLSGTQAVPVIGERIMWLNPLVCAAPEFTPCSGTVFEEELQINIHSEAVANGEIFLCFGEPEFWDDWQCYDGTFAIQHSQELHAEIWFDDGSASLTAHAEYLRRGTCELQLRRGWNLLGLPFELSPEELRKLQDMALFDPQNETFRFDAKSNRCGKVFWFFSSIDRQLPLTGIEPFHRGVPVSRKAGWEAVTVSGLDAECIQESMQPFWTWEQNRYQLAQQLTPGKGYWRFQQP